MTLNLVSALKIIRQARHHPLVTLASGGMPRSLWPIQSYRSSYVETYCTGKIRTHKESFILRFRASNSETGALECNEQADGEGDKITPLRLELRVVREQETGVYRLVQSLISLREWRAVGNTLRESKTDSQDCSEP